MRVSWQFDKWAWKEWYSGSYTAFDGQQYGYRTLGPLMLEWKVYGRQ